MYLVLLAAVVLEAGVQVLHPLGHVQRNLQLLLRRRPPLLHVCNADACLSEIVLHAVKTRKHHNRTELLVDRRGEQLLHHHQPALVGEAQQPHKVRVVQVCSTAPSA